MARKTFQRPKGFEGAPKPLDQRKKEEEAATKFRVKDGIMVESREQFEKRKSSMTPEVEPSLATPETDLTPRVPETLEPEIEQSVAQHLAQGDLMGAFQTLLNKESVFERGIGTAGTFEEGQALDPISTVGEIALESVGTVGSLGGASKVTRGVQAAETASQDALTLARQQSDELNRLAEEALKRSDDLISLKQAEFKILKNRQAMKLLFADIDQKGRAIATGQGEFNKVTQGANGILKPGDSLVDVFRKGKWVKEAPNTKEARIAQGFLTKAVRSLSPTQLIFSTLGIISGYLFSVGFRFNVEQDTLTQLNIELGEAASVGDIEGVNQINDRIQAVSKFTTWDGIKTVAGPLGLTIQFIEHSIEVGKSAQRRTDRTNKEGITAAEETARAEELAGLSVEEAIAMVDAGEVNIFDLPDNIESTVRAQISAREFEAARQ